ncbi:MAG: VPLPA-CTERM sorting domain-containing protein [Pedobacter sp.]
MNHSRTLMFKTLLFGALLTATMVSLPGAANAAISIDYSISGNQPSDASIYYNPNVDTTLHGVNLSVTGVRGNGTSGHSGETLAITSGKLNFQTGSFTSQSGNTLNFGTPGSFTLTGGIAALGLSDPTILVTGHFTSASVTSIDLVGNFKFDIVGAGLEDSDNKNIYSYFGVSDDFTCTNALALSFTANHVNGGFTSSTITGGILVDSPTPTPIPAAAWLLGSGLMGLVGVRRRRA